MNPFLKPALLLMTCLSLFAQGGLDTGIRIQDGAFSTTSKTARVTINALTNLRSGTLTASNLTASSTVVANSAKQLITGTNTGTGSYVLQQSPTIVTPTIASFGNAQHNHQNAAGGGTIAEAALNLSDNTTGDVSTARHGFVPKAPNDTGQFLSGDGTWRAGSADGTGNWTGSDSTNSALAGNLTAHNGHFTNGVTIGSPTVTLGSSGSGALTITAAGGNTEHIGLDLGTNANTGTFFTTSGLTTLDFGAIGLDLDSATTKLSTVTGAVDAGGASFELPNAAGSSALSAGGQIAVNTTDKQIGVHNGTKEVAVPLVYSKEISFDPKAVCDGSVDRLFLFTVGSWAPKGITITSWKISFEADPTTEVDLDLKRADAFIGVANSAVMDVLDTTTGAASESTAANINGGAVIANGKVVYLEFGTAYSETGHQIIFELTYELEED